MRLKWPQTDNGINAGQDDSVMRVKCFLFNTCCVYNKLICVILIKILIKYTFVKREEWQ